MGRLLGAPLRSGSKSMNREPRKLAQPNSERFEEMYSEEDGYRQEELYYMDRGYRNAYESEGGDEQDTALVRAALDRLAKAKTKGKTNVSIPLDELEALERRHGQDVATPPSTPSKKKLSTRSASLSNVGKKKKSSSPATPKSNSKAKISRKNSIDDAPNVLIQGPDGVPMYAQLAQLPAGYAHMPRSRSRSVSQSNRDITPPDQMFGTPGRFYARVPVSDREDGSPRPHYREEPVQVRRHFSGPPEIAFSTLRRVPPASSPLVPRPAPPQHSNSDPNVRRFEASSSSDDAVQVEVVPDGAGYAVSRAPLREVETRRRKIRR